MNRRLLLVLSFLLIVGGVLIVAVTMARGRRGAPIQIQTVTVGVDDTWKKTDWLEDYKLVERSGRTFDSHELKGHVHIVSFFFATCPTTCVNQNKQMQLLQRSFAGKDVKFLAITCDPKRDSPDALKAYAKKFDADPEQWLFLTGELPHIRRIGAEVYGVPVDEQTHTEKFLVYDKRGEKRGGFNWNRSAELGELRTLVDKLLAETEEVAASDKSSDGKPPAAVAEEKPGESKPDDAKAGDAKTSNAKAGDAKPEDAKPEAKIGDTPSDGKQPEKNNSEAQSSSGTTG
ncbi:MAG TPA: SCO family protein [Pirellulaceae bacterium]|nr:SCO family protein [Pirellulaceae bacterium]